MLKLNRKFEYAMIALKHMSQKAPGQLTTAKEICDAYRTPFDPTSRVLQIMAQNGILKAEQGAYGGYQITRDLSKLTVGAIHDLIDGPIKISSCIKRDHDNCDLTGSCKLVGPMNKLNERIHALFHEINLADFLEIRSAVSTR